jgi:lysyl-tRNA synthetase class 2
VEDFPDRFEVSATSVEAREWHDGTKVSVAGRLRLIRVFGGLTFGTLQDRCGLIQISLRRDDLGETIYSDWVRQLRVSAHVGISGEMWTTKTGERTVQVSHMTLLSLPRKHLPDKWAGLSDPEVVFRKRYLDLLYNEDSRARFLLRSKMIAFLRRYLDEKGFIEVETPILQNAASGASAKPFVTHHNALDIDLYLRIAPETYLKRLVAGSFERVYELGRNFRNEGMDPSHLQEFTMLEWYAAYWNYRDNIAFASELISSAVEYCAGSLIVEFGGREIDFSLPWKELDYRAALRDACGVDLREVRTADEVRWAAERRGIQLEAPPGVSYATLVDLLYKRQVRPHLIQPTLLLHHPAELVPLARRSEEDPAVLDMFQVVVGGWEVVKAYSELVDPIEQRSRLEEQVMLRAQGDEEAMMLEEDFLEAMEYGMPPMSGLGLGIDRLVALLTKAGSLREVVLFPPVRPAREHLVTDGTDEASTPS